MAPVPRTIRILIVRAVQIGRQDAAPGETWDVPRVDAAILLQDGFAVLAPGSKLQTPYTVTVETPEHGDPAPRRISAAPPAVAEKVGAKRE